MKKKILCANVNLVSPAVCGWSVELITVQTPDDSAAEPVSYPCSFEHLFEVFTSHGFTDPSLKKVANGILKKDDIHALDLLPYGLLHYFVGLLSSLGSVQMIPNGRGGIIIETSVDDHYSDLFKKLTND